MAAHGRFLLLACAACLGLALAAPPIRNAADCVDNNLLLLTGNLYPSTRQIQRPGFQERTTVQVAQNFEITYGSTFKILSNTVGTKNETYVLYHCGTPVPDLAQLGLPTTTKVFSVPLVALNAPDTTVLNFMKLLGVQDRVSYVTSYAVDPCMQLLSSPQCGNRSSKSAPEDAIDGMFTFSMDATNKKSIMFGATVENGPLRGAEYIKYVAAFFNQEAAANQVFTKIYNTYNALYSNVQSLRSSSNVTAPVVAWLYYQQAYPPSPEQINIKFHGFRPQYTGDAGGELPNLEQLKLSYVDKVIVNKAGDLQFVNLTSSATTEALRAILADVDVVIDESYVEGDVTKYTLDHFLVRYGLNYSTASTDLKFLRQKQVLRLDGTANAGGYTAWFEEALARPDVVLHDLISFINPAVLESMNDQDAPRLVRNLFPALTAPAGTVSGVYLYTAANCPLTSTQCGAAAKPICPAVYLDCAGKLVNATDAQPCAPVCTLKRDGAAGRAVVAPAIMIALLVTALAAVMGPLCSWL